MILRRNPAKTVAKTASTAKMRILAYNVIMIVVLTQTMNVSDVTKKRFMKQSQRVVNFAERIALNVRIRVNVRSVLDKM